jgi:hypothetical protein
MPAIVTKITNVRKHPNADRLQLATVLGTQVIVGMDAQIGDSVIYFDSTLQLSDVYLSANNLYADATRNKDTSIRGYFGNNGKVRAQRFRGEVSNGFVMPLSSLLFCGNVDISSNTDFTHVNGIEICRKYISKGLVKSQFKSRFTSDMFARHWDTKQLGRTYLPEGGIFYVEEKIHGTSGRTGKVLVKKWFWKTWKVVSGTRRVDNIDSHLPEIRQAIEDKVRDKLYKGETIYYEIYGGNIQPGFSYGITDYAVMLYRVTITTPDGFVVDLDRENVYARAYELGFNSPFCFTVTRDLDNLMSYASGQSAFDAGTLREGICVWFRDDNYRWTCVKHKNEEFLILEASDVEDIL